MKTKFFAAAAIVAGVLVYAALAGPVSAQPRGGFRHFGPPVRVFAPRVNYNFPTYNSYATPYLGYSAGYAAPYLGYSAGYATRYSGLSTNVTPFGTSYSGYSSQGSPRVLTPYGSFPTTYRAYSGGTTPFGSYSSSPYGGYSTGVTPFGTSYSGYNAQSFPRALTPYGSYPTTYGTYSGTASPFGSTFGYGYVSPYTYGQ